MEARALFRVSVDVGGTFTDLVALDEGTGELLNIKVPSVPRNPEKGVVTAFKQFLEHASAGSVRMVGHATTIATNALFGQVDLELPRTALITTRGFRDVVEIGRQRRAEVYNLFFQRPRMLVERRLRLEVEERIDSEGNVLVPLDVEGVERALDVIGREGVDSLAVGFLNSYANQVHEERVIEMARRRFPDLYVTASSLVSNEYREYERFSTAVVNAALMPIINAYVSQLAVDLKGLGVASPLYVMQSNGGMATAAVVVERPATIVESGPASGVIAAAWLGGLVGERDIISFDMGGTTAKAGTVRGRVPEVIPEYEVAGRVHMGRLVKGSGYPVRFPFIDLAECSAGGGTIAWVDEGGALRVGPTSAGAHPGPACYGQGGTDPTITDANLILGRLNPERLLGGEMPIFPRYAREAFKLLGDRLGVGAEEAAVSVVRIANSMMSKILRIVSVERGFDPRCFTLVAFGGAGPMHACALAEELQVAKIIVPPNPGMFSALGLLTADLFHDYTRALVERVDEVDPEAVESYFREMEERGRETLEREGV
ncbi:MAG: hydantoinase/oxoprolinase family protein, partial [Candidatus Bathyarchaeia archaeon]